MADIYERHTAAFKLVSAFVILDKTGERVATVALKFPADGAGRLFAYVHLIGASMVRAHASGYGYDKRTAAVESAIAKIPVYGRSDYEKPDSEYARAYMLHRELMQEATKSMGGLDWVRALEIAGFKVFQAV